MDRASNDRGKILSIPKWQTGGGFGNNTHICKDELGK